MKSGALKALTVSTLVGMWGSWTSKNLGKRALPIVGFKNVVPIIL